MLSSNKWCDSVKTFLFRATSHMTATVPPCQTTEPRPPCAPVTEHSDLTRRRRRWEHDLQWGRNVTNVLQDKPCDCSGYPTYEYGPPAVSYSYGAPAPSYNPPCAFRRTFGNHGNKDKDKSRTPAPLTIGYKLSSRIPPPNLLNSSNFHFYQTWSWFHYPSQRPSGIQMSSGSYQDQAVLAQIFGFLITSCVTFCNITSGTVS